MEVNGVGLWPKTRSKRCQVIGLEGCDQLGRVKNGPKSLDMEVMRVHFKTFLLENWGSYIPLASHTSTPSDVLKEYPPLV